ncbi:hypothetical protein CC1G_05777 [Coprinopsis cinerea okayama7|uniref:F-box domain-containing protein n=1 Tax=Coprinopsis cinerea (strain Okayama-7 / 130 / ATCC MYA-4618 / FGSC 9003) TaxID=240176 RepID=A8NLA6_COPC7|nr:hypothetical protein CC1G_05777 [Coprinopsis cinerea okayama7\|eukprot:XP_001834640.2 hypothetical protein CC1G_05777 [Coprinopsis cinerea okayama7\
MAIAITHATNQQALTHIHSLPPEILAYIFLLCLTDASHLPTPYRTPLLLCQVCRYWRYLSERIPFLWMNLEVAVTPSRKPHSPISNSQPSISFPGHVHVAPPTCQPFRSSAHLIPLSRAHWITRTWLANAYPLPLSSLKLKVSRFASGFRTDWESSEAYDGFCQRVLEVVLGLDGGWVSGGKITEDHAMGFVLDEGYGSRGPGIERLELEVDYLTDIPGCVSARQVKWIHTRPLTTLVLRASYQSYLDDPRHSSQFAAMHHSISPFSSACAPQLQDVTLDVPWPELVSFNDNPYHIPFDPLFHANLSPLFNWEKLTSLSILQPIPVHIWRLLLSRSLSLETGRFEVFPMDSPTVGWLVDDVADPTPGEAVLPTYLHTLHLVLNEKGVVRDQHADNDATAPLLFHTTVRNTQFLSSRNLTLASHSKQGFDFPVIPLHHPSSASWTLLDSFKCYESVRSRFYAARKRDFI